MKPTPANTPVPPTSLWKDDEDLFRIINNELYTAVVGDIMDKMGFYHQFLFPAIRPLTPSMRIAGRAMPVLEADVPDAKAAGQNPVLSKPFGLMLEALDDLKPGEVYICSGSSPSYALWGELMSARAIALGAAGAVLNGYCRDTNGILALNFPTFCYGSYAQDQAPRGKVIDYRIPIKVGEVMVKPGDIVIGDIDGVCIVPQDIMHEVFVQAIEKVRGEKMVKQKIIEGMSARQAFDDYGIL